MHIKSFSEKPNLKKAKQLISQNNAYWNSGIFLVSAKHALNSINYYNDKIAKSCEKVFRESKFNKKFNEVNFNKDEFNKIDSISIDYSVLEKSNSILVKPVNFIWNDIGSWDSYSKLNTHTKEKNNIFEINSKIILFLMKIELLLQLE